MSSSHFSLRLLKQGFEKKLSLPAFSDARRAMPDLKSP
jgi:hypothetical protein